MSFMNKYPQMIPKTGDIRSDVRILMVPPTFKMLEPPCAMAAPAIPPKSACEELTGRPMRMVMMFHRMAEINAEIMTTSVTAFGSTIPVPIVFATAVERKAPRMFMPAARTTAVIGDRTLVDTTVAMALAQSCHPFATSKNTARIIIRIRISCIFEDDTFEYVGDVFRSVRGVFEQLVDVFPLDDVNGVIMIVDELAEGVAVLAVDPVLEPVDLDAVLLHAEILLRAELPERLFQDIGGHLEVFGNGNDLRRRLFDLVHCHSVHGGPHQVDDIGDPGRERMDVFAVDGGEEGFVQVLHDVVSEHVAFLLELVDDFCLFFERLEVVQGVDQDVRRPGNVLEG